MKSILFIAISLFALNSAFAETKVLEYQYGNQITSSTLELFDNGRINHTESTCCAPSTNTVDEPTLSAPETKFLLNWIRRCATDVQEEVRPVGKSQMGSSAGKLTAFYLNQPINVRTIEFSEFSEADPLKLTFNKNEGCRTLEYFVKSKVSNWMQY